MSEFKILKPVKITKPAKTIIIKNAISSTQVKNLLKSLGTRLAVDIETNGTQAADKTIQVIGLGISNGTDNIYFHRRAIGEIAYHALLAELTNPKLELIAHNVFFDSAFLYRDLTEWMPWRFCTYGLYRQLANEGFQGQSWSLKSAQIDLLGWEETNEKELDQWLVTHGHWKTPSKSEKDNHYLIMTENGERWVKPDKSKMSEAPADILGYYCALDAYSTYHLFDKVLLPAILNLPVPLAVTQFFLYHDEFIKQVKLHVYQQLRGIKIDQEMLENHLKFLTKEIENKKQEFLVHPEVSEYIKEYNQNIYKEYKNKEPAKYRKPPKIGKEPAKFTKSGEASKVWINWDKKRQRANEPVVSKNWLTWEENYNNLLKENHFNINSGSQLQWLFYEKLKYPVILRTDKGHPAVDKRALLAWGEAGQILKKQNDLVKEEGYVQGCLRSLINNTLHPQFRMPGTLTCRLAGSGGVNIQQLPKSRGYLSCYIPRAGYTWLDCDHSSLEQVVLAELSRDPTLLKLYGPNAKPNDVYLFNGSYLQGIKVPILKAGYDPDNPTKEGISNAKKQAKTARSIAKVVTLASSYGAGAAKIRETLTLQGVDISFDEAKKIHSDYWELYSGIKQYEQYLKDEYNKRDGWIYNGLGRPICVDGNYLKDIVNRVVQSTGHDIHILWVNIFKELCDKKGLEVHGIVWDFHDQSIVECPIDQASEVNLTFLEAYDKLNERLGGLIPLKGDPKIVNNLAEAKLEE